jgi:hypothetical protein
MANNWIQKATKGMRKDSLALEENLVVLVVLLVLSVII